MKLKVNIFYIILICIMISGSISGFALNLFINDQLDSESLGYVSESDLILIQIIQLQQKSYITPNKIFQNDSGQVTSNLKILQNDAFDNVVNTVCSNTGDLNTAFYNYKIGIHPIIFISSLMTSVSSDWKPSTVAEVELVGCVTSSTSVRGSCTYVDSDNNYSNVNQNVRKKTINIRESLTAAIVKTQTLSGNTPACPSTLAVGINNLYGNNPSPGLIVNTSSSVVDLSYELTDSDSDGLPDAWEDYMGLNKSFNDANLDLDSDGIPNIYEYNVDLNVKFNDANLDKDNDGLTNLLEFTLGSSVNNNDSDGDSIDDLYEYQMGLNIVSDDSNEDKDGDGIPNLWEYQNGLKANENDASLDKDEDGLTNYQEYTINSNPNKSDTDSDGLPDKLEFETGLDININDAQLDKDGDGLPNLWEYQMGLNLNDAADALTDLDGDSLSNILEFNINSNILSKDTDSDGMTDDYEFFNNLNLNLDDSRLDSDNDFVSNIDEFNAGSSASDILSVPIFSFSIIHMLIGIGLISLSYIGFKKKTRIQEFRKKPKKLTNHKRTPVIQTINHKRTSGVQTMNKTIVTDVFTKKIRLKDLDPQDVKLMTQYQIFDIDIAKKIKKQGYPSYLHYLKDNETGDKVEKTNKIANTNTLSNIKTREADSKSSEGQQSQSLTQPKSEAKKSIIQTTGLCPNCNSRVFYKLDTCPKCNTIFR